MGIFGGKKKAERTVPSLRAHQNHPEEFVRNTIIPPSQVFGADPAAVISKKVNLMEPILSLL